MVAQDAIVVGTRWFCAHDTPKHVKGEGSWYEPIRINTCRKNNQSSWSTVDRNEIERVEHANSNCTMCWYSILFIYFLCTIIWSYITSVENPTISQRGHESSDVAGSKAVVLFFRLDASAILSFQGGRHGEMRRIRMLFCSNFFFNETCWGKKLA